MNPVRSVVVLGGGSAGFLAAITLKTRRPDLNVRVIRSKDIPIIGVGEGTTAAILRALHSHLQIDAKAFYREVHPVPKLEIYYLWGPRPSFNYTFGPQMTQRTVSQKWMGYFLDEDINHAGIYSSLVAHNRVFFRDPKSGRPFISRWHGYHLENKTFVAYLESLAVRRSVDVIDDTVTSVELDDNGVRRLHCKSGQAIEADLYVDCSGFASELLGKALHEPFISFRSTLFCDRAVVGGWPRGDEPIQPYTTAETMDAGWCWRIDHEHLVNRGYVYSSSFISDEQADVEFRTKNPKVKNTRIVKFRTGRYERSWVKNVVAIGNASGFVEPLEATAIAAICEQSKVLAFALSSSPHLGPRMSAICNARDARYWDAIRRFLAIHYAFNTRIDTAFWQEARVHTDLAGAEEVVEFYRENGPDASWAEMLLDTTDQFGMEGYLALLVGQNVPHASRYTPTAEEAKQLRAMREKNSEMALAGYTVEQALAILHQPQFKWSEGFFD